MLTMNTANPLVNNKNKKKCFSIGLQKKFWRWLSEWTATYIDLFTEVSYGFD